MTGVLSCDTHAKASMTGEKLPISALTTIGCANELAIFPASRMMAFWASQVAPNCCPTENGNTFIVAPLSTRPKTSIELLFNLRVIGNRGKLSICVWLECVVEYVNRIRLSFLLRLRQGLASV
jgi:hypothetical protein